MTCNTLLLSAATLLAEYQGKGSMIALRPPLLTAKKIARYAFDQKPADIHVTLVHFPDELSAKQKMTVKRVATKIAGNMSPMNMRVQGVGWFRHNDGVAWASVDGVGMAKLRTALCDAITKAGIAYSSDYDFTPHLTLGYGVPLKKLREVPEIKWLQDNVLLSFQGEDDPPIRFGKGK